MLLSLTVPSTRYGSLHVTADVSPGRYDIAEVKDADGNCFCGAVHGDVLEEIETAVEFEYQCARYDEAFANCDDLRAFDFHTL